MTLVKQHSQCGGAGVEVQEVITVHTRALACAMFGVTAGLGMPSLPRKLLHPCTVVLAS